MQVAAIIVGGQLARPHQSLEGHWIFFPANLDKAQLSISFRSRRASLDGLVQILQRIVQVVFP